MADYSVIADVSRYLLELLREAVCPSLLATREQVSLGAPDSGKNDALLLLYLYSIRDFGEFVPERAASPHSGMAFGKSLPITLQYVAYLNKNSQTPLDSLAEHRILGRAMQVLHSNSTIDIANIHSAADSGDEPVAILFSKLDEQRKQEIWNGFSQPMRPAVYFEAGSLLLSGGARVVPRVRQIEGGVGRI